MKNKISKDWEKYYSDIWAQPNNIRFMKPIKRVLDTPPPIQVFPPRDVGASIGDVAVFITLVVTLIFVLITF